MKVPGRAAIWHGGELYKIQKNDSQGVAHARDVIRSNVLCNMRCKQTEHLLPDYIMACTKLPIPC